MYKYRMIIDNTPYNALFEDHFVAADFLDENDRDGSEVVVLGYTEVAPYDILNDSDFEWAYRVEMASAILLPNANEFRKWEQLEAELERLGLLS